MLKGSPRNAQGHSTKCSRVLHHQGILMLDDFEKFLDDFLDDFLENLEKVFGGKFCVIELSSSVFWRTLKCQKICQVSKSHVILDDVLKS